jgi:hypothetical protein
MWLACALTAWVASAVPADARARGCRVLCRPAIEACLGRAVANELGAVPTERARRRAVRQLRRRCRSGLVTACRKAAAACAAVTTTTVPATPTTVPPVTTTTLPDSVTGLWRFEGDGVETCAAFEEHVEVSLRLHRSGPALAGTWFADASASGHGTMTGPHAFTFALDGVARHFPCFITGLVLDGEDMADRRRGTLTATAACGDERCGGEWRGTLMRLAP